MQEKLTKRSRKEVEQKPIFDGLEGTYLGFSPTDESDVGIGEIELTITKDEVKYRMATGLEITEDNVLISETGIKEFPKENLHLFIEEPENVEGVRVFGAEGEPWIIFTPEEEERAAVRLFNGEVDDIYMPTYLFTPRQIDRGLMEKAVTQIEKEFGRQGAIPRLFNYGRALTSE